MADLGQTTADLVDKVQEALGWADDVVEEQLQALAYLNDAYRRVIKGKHPATGVMHLWSWLRKLGTLTWVDGTNVYALANDFSGMFPAEVPYYAHVDNENFPQFRQTSIAEWNELIEPEMADNETEAYLFCVRPIATFVAGTGQRWEMCVYPTPDEARTVYYAYRFHPEALADSATYHMGGPEYDRILYTGAMAEHEKRRGTPDGPWEAEFSKAMIDAIEFDSAYTDFTSPDESHFDVDLGL